MDTGSIRSTKAIGSACLMIRTALGGRFKRNLVKSIFVKLSPLVRLAGTLTNEGGRTMVCVLSKSLFFMSLLKELLLGCKTLDLGQVIGRAAPDVSVTGRRLDVLLW